MKTLLALFCLASAGFAQPNYDLILQGGRVVDGKNKIAGIRDVAIKDGLIAEVAAKIDPAKALKTINVAGLYVTPGLIDIHVHVYAGTGERGSYAGDLSVYPDGFTLRSGVTTVVDAGSSGYKNFEDFKAKVIDRSRTRVLALINIVGAGMRGGMYESNQQDMEPAPAAAMAQKYRDVIVGVKSAHYAGPEWTSVEHAVEAGTIANIPVMVDFGNDHPERPLADLLTKKLRPGDIYTHCFSGLRHELIDGKVNPGMIEGRKRGIFFDVGHGGGSFAWRIAAPAIKQGFIPDSISTDLHTTSMNAAMKDMLLVMSKMLALGLPADDVIVKSTWNPAKEIKREELGNLSVGAIADVAVLRVETGKFGFLDMYGARLPGTKKFAAEMTIKGGKVVWDLNGLGRPAWQTLPEGYTQTGDARWDAVHPARAGRGGRGGRGGATATPKQ